MHVRRHRVLAPGDVEACLVEVLGLGAADLPERADHGLRARHGADLHADARRAHAVPEAIRVARRQNAHMRQVAVREDRPPAALLDDLGEAVRDERDCLLPVRLFEWRVLRFTHEWCEQAVGMMDELLVVLEAPAQPAVRDRMLGIARDLDHASVLDAREHPACVRAVLRADRLHDRGHAVPPVREPSSRAAYAAGYWVAATTEAPATMRSAAPMRRLLTASVSRRKMIESTTVHRA